MNADIIARNEIKITKDMFDKDLKEIITHESILGGEKELTIIKIIEVIKKDGSVEIVDGGRLTMSMDLLIKACKKMIENI